MIYNYEIKVINGEEKLYLYLDLNYEFANLDFKTKKKSLEKAINEFMIKNKIVFKGSIISLIVGGLIVGDLILKQPVLSKQSTMIDAITPKIMEVDNLMRIPELPKLEEEIEILDLNENNKIKNNVNKSTTNNSINNKMVTENKSNNNSVSKNKEIDNNIYVNVKRSNGQIENIELEEYLIGVVGAEMPALFNIEALKCQAVVSRTYALKSLQDGKMLTDNETTQSYKSKSELESMWGKNFNNYYNKVKTAVNETKGEYLTYNGKYIEAVFHSTSNGRTEDASNVWKNNYPYLISVESPYDKTNPSFQYEKELSYPDISKKLGINVNKDSIINILGKTIGNRVSQVSIDNKIFSGVEFRNKLGLRSADFELAKLDTGIKFKTYGYGHGVGMSQYGANVMAKNGYKYDEILKYYYTGINIKK